ncbi:MAG: tetratricopeptide repeat protein [Candidatus Azotimanducaceae bacterium WSBS_2022_MAG_OTU7]
MKQLMTLIILMSVCSSGFAATSVLQLQKDWAVANYELQNDEQERAFKQLIEKASNAVSMEPNNAELLIWKAIIQSTYAGKAGGFNALSLVKSARADLEAAMEIDPMALNGSAYTSLGALYYQVPSWPIAFGSSKKARKLLEKAIAVNPDGIDSNYFYGAFLVKEEAYDSARQALTKAMEATPRPGRELADSGRRAEIRKLLSQLNES